MWIRCKKSLLFQRRWMHEWKTVLCHKVMDWDYPYNYAQQIKCVVLVFFVFLLFSILGERNLHMHTQSSLGISAATITAWSQVFRSALWVALIESKFAIWPYPMWLSMKQERRREDIPIKKEYLKLFSKQKKRQRKMAVFLALSCNLFWKVELQSWSKAVPLLPVVAIRVGLRARLQSEQEVHVSEGQESKDGNPSASWVLCWEDYNAEGSFCLTEGSAWCHFWLWQHAFTP